MSKEMLDLVRSLELVAYVLELGCCRRMMRGEALVFNGHIYRFG
jgi:hypothetical protein